MPKVMIVKYRFPVHSVAVHMLKMIEKAPLCIMSWGEGFDLNDGFIAGESDLESRIENRDIIFTSDELVCFDEAKFWMSPGDLSEISISCTENEKGKYIEGEAYEWGLVDKPKLPEHTPQQIIDKLSTELIEARTYILHGSGDDVAMSQCISEALDFAGIK